MREKETISTIGTIIGAIMFFGGLLIILMTVFQSEHSNENISDYYEVVNVETKEHIGIRVSQRESNMIIEEDMRDIEVPKENLEIKEDDDKEGTYKVTTYEAKDRKVSLGVANELKTYIVYVPE